MRVPGGGSSVPTLHVLCLKGQVCWELSLKSSNVNGIHMVAHLVNRSQSKHGHYDNVYETSFFCLIICKQCYCPLVYTRIHGNLISLCTGTEGSLNFYLKKLKNKSSMLLELYKREDTFPLDSISNSVLLVHWRLSDTLNTQQAPSKSPQRFLFKMCLGKISLFPN